MVYPYTLINFFFTHFKIKSFITNEWKAYTVEGVIGAWHSWKLGVGEQNKPVLLVVVDFESVAVVVAVGSVVVVVAVGSVVAAVGAAAVDVDDVAAPAADVVILDHI